MTFYGWAVIVAAFITALPATVAARAALKASRNSMKASQNSETSNGQTQAQIVEEIRAEQVKIALALLGQNRVQAEDRRMMVDHIAQDLAFQHMIEPFLKGRDKPAV